MLPPRNATHIASQLKGRSPVAVGQHCTRQPQQAFGRAFGFGGLHVVCKGRLHRGPGTLKVLVGSKDGELEQRPC